MLEDLIWMFAKCHGMNHLLFLILDYPHGLGKSRACRAGASWEALLLHAVERITRATKCTVLVVKATRLTLKLGQQV